LHARGEKNESPISVFVLHPSRQSRPRDTKLSAACIALRRRRRGAPRQTSDKVAAKLVALVRFMSTDQAFSQARRYE